MLVIAPICSFAFIVGLILGALTGNWHLTWAAPLGCLIGWMAVGWPEARHLFGTKTYNYPVLWWKRWLIGAAWMIDIKLGGFALDELAPESQCGG